MVDRARIIELNDLLRTSFKGGTVRVATSAYDLDARLCGRALCAMSRSARIDPDGNHDRGRFVFAGYLFAWEIAYRASHGTGLSTDPADPEKTSRLLTLYPTADLLIRPLRTSQPEPGG